MFSETNVLSPCKPDVLNDVGNQDDFARDKTRIEQTGSRPTSWRAVTDARPKVEMKRVGLPCNCTVEARRIVRLRP